MSGLYNKDYDFLTWQNELEVVFSVMTDQELMSVKDRVEEMIKQEAYIQDKFPLSCGGLRSLQATIMFSFWVRKGKGIKVVEGEIVVCELKESPFWERYQQPDLYRDEESGEYYVDSPEHERDIQDKKCPKCGNIDVEDGQPCECCVKQETEEERGEFV